MAPISGLIDYWKGDGNAQDSVGSYNGTFYGDATTALGRFGNAFSLDGTGDYVCLLYTSDAADE